MGQRNCLLGKDVVVGYEDVFDGEGNYLYTREITEFRSGIGTGRAIMS